MAMFKLLLGIATVSAAVTTSPEIADPLATQAVEDWWKKGCDGGLGGGYTTIGGGMGGMGGMGGAGGFTSYFTSYFTETIPAQATAYITIPGDVTTIYYTPQPVTTTVNNVITSVITLQTAITGPAVAVSTSSFTVTL